MDLLQFSNNNSQFDKTGKALTSVSCHSDAQSEERGPANKCSGATSSQESIFLCAWCLALNTEVRPHQFY
jgi:hypothetical protein